MDSVHGEMPQTTMSNDFGIHSNNLLLASPLVSSSYNVTSLKDSCSMLRSGNNSGYLPKDEFMPEMATDMSLNVDVDFENRYRENRPMNPNFSKMDTSSPYELKTLNHDIQDLSFTEDLRSLHREPSSMASFGYYSKNISPGPDIYNQDFPNDFTSNNFTNSLPSTSTMFSHDGYVMPENQTDDMLLNGIDLSDNEKLVLSNEELAILTQGKPGSCLELILNNGEVLYAVIDSENEFGSTSRLMQIPKEMIAPGRQCSLPVEMNSDMAGHMNESHYDSNLPESHNFSSKSSPVEHFDVSARSYHHQPVISNSLPKSMNSSENFNLCCDFPSTDNSTQFSSDINPYTTIVSTKSHSPFHDSALQKSDLTYTCASGTSSNKQQIPVIQNDAKIMPNTSVEQPESRIDYFPSAVNSIIVSETGKKYPKKYSFYSNNFSSFLNQESSFDKNNTRSNIDSSKICELPCTTAVEATVQDMTQMGQRMCSSMNSVNGNVNTGDLLSSSVSTPSNMNVAGVAQMTTSIKSDTNASVDGKISLGPVSQNTAFCHIDLSTDDDDVMSSSTNEFMADNLLSEDDNIKNKFLISRTATAVNSICDQAIQSRARATLPSNYLSINRIKNELNNSKPLYGVFARKTIPSRTQFGPIEGVLVKEEEDEEAMKLVSNQEDILQLTVQSETGKSWRLDVSNEDLSNWMRYVRPASCYKEQNLVLSQQGSSLYFTSMEVIHPNQQLLVWYGALYSRNRNYKLLTGDPCADVAAPYDMMERIGDLSSILNSDKTRMKETFESNDKSIGSEEYGHQSNASIPNEEFVEKKTKAGAEREAVKYACCLQNDKSIVSEEYDHESNACIPNEEFVEKETNTKQNGRLKKSPTEPQRAKRQSRRNDKSNKSLWLCNSCDLTFSSGAVMNLHAFTHVDNSDQTSAQLNDSETPNTEQQHSCPQCNQVFVDRKELISHVSKHGLKVQRWTDNKTAESCSSEEQKDEKRSNDENFGTKRYPCQYCKKVLKSAVALGIHERIHSDDSSLECPLCDATFQKLTAMKEHVHTHAKNGIFTCPHCPKTHERYKVIRKHIRSCHVTAKYVCKQCKKSFRSQYKLRTHMLRHSDQRQFLCANCGKQFKRIDKLTEHIKKIHSEERERKSLEIISNPSSSKTNKKMLKKKLPNKVLRLITENVNDYFYKCYICNIGFKRRGMLVNHLGTFHPNVSLDTIPELNVPILKAYCNFFCLYCDRVYKSNSKRKAHILKSHPGAKLPCNSERGTMLNDPYAKHVKDVILDPFSCDFCYRQYASRAKLLSHHRKDHSDLLPSDMKYPQKRSTQKRKKKPEPKKDEIASVDTNSDTQTVPATENKVQLQNMEFEISSGCSTTVNIDAQEVITLQNTVKDNENDVNQAALNEVLRNPISQEQYLKIFQIAQSDENSSAIFQQFLTSYSFPNA